MTQPKDSNENQNASKNSAAESNAKADSKKDKKKDKSKEKRKGNTYLLIIIILMLAFIITFGAIFMFNFAGLKAETSVWLTKIPVVGKLIKPVVENKTAEQIAMEEIDQQKRVLTVKENDLNEIKKELDKRTKEIESKEKELSDKELQVNDMLLKLSDKLTSIQEQVQYLEKVDNAKAMQIIMNMDDKASAVQILRNMKRDKASAILALMDPLQAAQILEGIAELPPVQEATEEVKTP
jgi:flagellar motility protein MotE (MotC chaperone)